MRIGIILHPYGEKNPGGLARAIFELTKAFVEQGTEHEFVLFVRAGSPSPHFPGTNWRVQTCTGGILWLDRGLRLAPTLDVCIFNTPIMPFWYRPKRSIVICYDFAYYKLSLSGRGARIRRFLLRNYHGFSLRASSRIVTISEAVKRDVIEIFAIAPKKIDVIYLGLNRICDAPVEPCKVPEEFLLFVGAIKERKNVMRIVQAFEEFQKAHPAYHLLLVGKDEGAYAQDLKRYVEKRKLESHVRFKGYVSDGELAYLYQKAVALVFPSLLEGFSGFPVFEAMGCGLPVITSTETPFIEAAENAALKVNPYDVGAIASTMERVACDSKLRQDLIQKGRACVAKFSWEKTADAWLRLITQESGGTRIVSSS